MHTLVWSPIILSDIWMYHISCAIVFFRTSLIFPLLKRRIVWHKFPVQPIYRCLVLLLLGFFRDSFNVLQFLIFRKRTSLPLLLLGEVSNKKSALIKMRRRDGVMVRSVLPCYKPVKVTVFRNLSFVKLLSVQFVSTINWYPRA